MLRVNISLLLSVLCCFLFVNGDLTLDGVQCGTLKCNHLEYCSSFDKLCKPCSEICDENNHNLDKKRCELDCQNYLHDIRYLKGQASTQNDSDLRAEVRNLHYMVSVTLSLTILILIVLGIVVLVKTCRWKNKHHVTLSYLRKKFRSKEKSKNEKSQNGVAVTISSGKPDLRLDMPPVGLSTPSVNGNTPSTATTTLSRRPTEDNTLDYAYDNPVMVSTPSPNAKPHESSL